MFCLVPAVPVWAEKQWLGSVMARRLTLVGVIHQNWTTSWNAVDCDNSHATLHGRVGKE